MLRRKHGKIHSFFNINTRRTCKWQDSKIYQVKFIGSVKYMVSSKDVTKVNKETANNVCEC